MPSSFLILLAEEVIKFDVKNRLMTTIWALLSNNKSTLIKKNVNNILYHHKKGLQLGCYSMLQPPKSPTILLLSRCCSLERKMKG